MIQKFFARPIQELLLTAAVVALLIGALAAAGIAVTLGGARAQSVPVWEPGDPLPGDRPEPMVLTPEPERPSGDTREADARDADAREADARPEITDMGPDTAVTPGVPLPLMTPAKPGATTAAPAAAPAASPPATETATDDTEDFLCTRAPQGTALPVPPPFDLWLVRVCTEQGQALVPVLGEAWVAHSSADIVSIMAMPPGAAMPAGDKLDPRYDIRFTGFAGEKAEGARAARAAALLTAATPAGTTAPAHDEVWQLDVASNIGETRYNLFFYVKETRPTRIIACLDQCRQALYLDVLAGADAAHVLGR